MGIIFCVVSFTTCLLLGRSSLPAGLGGLLTIGYLYGIVRANYLDSYSYLLFDAGVIGLYLAQLPQILKEREDERLRVLGQWVIVLLGWVAIVFLIPSQPLLVRVVGLRGNGYLLPFVLLGARLRREDALQLALYLGALNLMALLFGAAEFLFGIERFLPRNAATALIYTSHDVAGQMHRIPASFTNAHAYGGTMVATLPWLVGAWVQPYRRAWFPWVLLAGMGAGMLGIFLCAARSPAVILFGQLVLVTLFVRLRGSLNFGWLVMVAALAYLISNEERLQRFLTLGDTNVVAGRIGSSVNASFWDLLARYPMGNGMGGGGTSLPYFLESMVNDPVAMENEYSRILLEQGLIGLVLWFAFLVWAFSRFRRDPNDPWRSGRLLLWWTCLASFANGMIGIGLMTSIPQTTIVLLGLGFITVRPASTERLKWRTEVHAS